MLMIGNVFFYDSYGGICEILDIKNGDKIEKRKYLDFKEGDLVQIREWDDMVRQYGMNNYGAIGNGFVVFVKEMKRFCGKKYIIKKGFRLSPFGHKEQIDAWTIINDFLEIVTEGYVKKMKVELDGKEKKSSNTDLIKEMITKVDRKKVERILAGSYNIPLTSLTGLDKLLEQWAEAKQDMYLLFGKKLKIEKQIEFELGSREISNKLEELCNDYPVFMYILNHIDDKELEENKYMGSCTSLHALSNNIQRNMKITRFFSIAMNNEKFDIDISKIYENRKCKETICISIDPVDYLLMSINKSGWESCHKLHDMKANSAHSWGCYSAGTISYMVDTATLIAYKHSDKIYEYQINKCKIKEYSKNWRQVIYYDNNTHAFLTSREYPYSDENVANEVRKLLEDIINKGLGVDEKWIFVRNVGENYCCDITDLHYNDVLNDRENVFCRLDYVNKENVRFAIGGSPICPICGVNEIIVERHPMCEECYNDLL